MASNINTTDIDTEFPVPGQDNDSQGFRDNFTTILANFSAAKTEIETLQTNTVKVNADSTFLDNEQSNPASLINANLKAHTEQYYVPEEGNVGVSAGTYTINFTNGGYQVITLGGNTDFIFDGWPSSGRYAKIIGHFRNDGTTRTATFDNTEGNLLYESDNSSFWNGGNVSINSQTNPHIIEFWTYDGGSNVFAKYLGQYTTTAPGA
jgi:hypothetical protein